MHYVQSENLSDDKIQLNFNNRTIGSQENLKSYVRIGTYIPFQVKKITVYRLTII